MPTFSAEVQKRLKSLMDNRSTRSIERGLKRGNNWLRRKLTGEVAWAMSDVDEVLEFLKVPPEAILGPQPTEKK